jgi:competence protein ComEC
VHPQYALISVGRHNLFGHPSPSTIAALRDAGASIVRTDRDGAISVTTDGAKVEVDTMLAR